MGSIITLTSDFGTCDSYVASMKGVILGIAPDAHIIDITHAIPAQDVEAAAFVISTCAFDFPNRTIHVVVVDPEVGGTRAAIAIHVRNHFFVGPDNGVFSWILHKQKAWTARKITNPSMLRHPISSTFHGRDIFAPAAAHMAQGAPFDELGPIITPRWQNWPSPQMSGDVIRGTILHIDRFGNGITSITTAHLGTPNALENIDHVIVGDIRVDSIVRTFSEVPVGEPCVYVDSWGHVEIAVNQGRAAESLGFSRGDPVRVFTRHRGNEPHI